MKNKLHFKTLKNLIDRHPQYYLYHHSIGRKPAHMLHEYAEAHKRPVTIEWNKENGAWDIVKW